MRFFGMKAIKKEYAAMENPSMLGIISNNVLE
jgi:hypothetical protein